MLISLGALLLLNSACAAYEACFNFQHLAATCGFILPCHARTQFFMFVLLHYLTIVYADSMYRALGAAAPDLVIGNAISSFILLISLVTLRLHHHQE